MELSPPNRPDRVARRWSLIGQLRTFPLATESPNSGRTNCYLHPPASLS